MAAPIKDRFDAVPEDLHRVGAHRAPAPRGRGWAMFGWAVLATGILVVAGLWALAQLNEDISFDLPGVVEEQPPALPGEEPAEPEEVEPQLDPEVRITVLNGTGETGQANAVGDFLAEQGWNGAAEGVGTRATASADDVEATLIYYSDPVNEAAARALIDTLGVGELRLENTYKSSPITVLVGRDLTLPGN